jgi:hypothetical protein
MTSAADLAPAPFDANARGHAHAAWTWTFQLNALNAQCSLSHLTVAQLRDVRLGVDLFGALVDAEIGRQAAAS